MRYNTIGTHYGTVANGDVGQYAHIVAQPYMVANLDGTVADDSPLNGWNDKTCIIGSAMRIIGNKHVGTR